MSQLRASQLSLDVVKSQAEIEANKKIAEERVKFEKEKEVLETELLRRRKEEIGKMKNDFETQLSVLKLQVEKSDELRTKEVGFPVFIPLHMRYTYYISLEGFFPATH